MRLLVSRLVGLILIIVIGLSSIMSTTATVAQPTNNYGIVDQACRTVDSFHLRSPGAEAPAGQIFAPTQTSIVGFSIDIQSQSGDPDVLAQIYSGGLSRTSVIAQAHFSIPVGFGSNSSTGAWYHVSLPAGVSVTPNAPYALQLIDNAYSSNVLFLWYQCSDNYAGGSYYICLGNSGPECGPSVTGSSFSFITYSGDFGISSTNLLIARGSSNTTQVSVNSIFNFSSPVALSVGKSADGVTTEFDILTVAPASNSSATATLTVSVVKTIPIGTYSITLDATDGVLIHSTEINFTVEPSDFTIGLSRGSDTPIHLTQGQNITTTISVASIYGFNSTVMLTPSWNGPAPSDVDITILTPLISAPGTSELILSAGQHAHTGNYSLRIKASSGAVDHNANIQLEISPNATNTATTTANGTFSKTTLASAYLSVPWSTFESLIGLVLAFTVLMTLRIRRIEKKTRSR